MFSINHYPGWLNRPSAPEQHAYKGRRVGIIVSLLLLSFSITVTPYAQAAKNKKPVVKIAKIAAVDEGANVVLDGSGSTDKDGQIVTWLWEQTKGSPSVTINNANAAIAGFTAPAPERNAKKTKPAKLTFKLTATDNGTDTPALSANKTVVVTIKPVVKTPTANAGADQTVAPNTAVTLDGSASSDAEDGGLIVKWQWRQIIPKGQAKSAKVKLQNPKAAVATFTSPSVAQTQPLQFELTVTDNDGKKASDTLTVTVSEQQPPQPLAATFNVSSTTVEAGRQIIASANNVSGGTPPYTVTFDWGDQSTPTTGSQTSAAHAYAQAGTYTLKTTISDSGDAEDKVNTTTITVTEVALPPVSGELSLAASQVEFNSPVQATIANISGGTKPYRVTFDWGDSSSDGPTQLGQEVTSANAEHFYELVGAYTIKVTITDANGQVKEYVISATVTEVAAPLLECN